MTPLRLNRKQRYKEIVESEGGACSLPGLVPIWNQNASKIQVLNHSQVKQNMGCVSVCAYRNVLNGNLAPFSSLRNVCLALQRSQEITYPLLIASSGMRETDDKLGVI